MKKEIIALIGCGNMGMSLLAGLIHDGYPADNIWVSAPTLSKLNLLKEKFSIHITTQNEEAVRAADVVIFAVKPQILHHVTREVSAAAQNKKPLIISIAAGVTEKNLQKELGNHSLSIVRAMPNTPVMIGCGATGLFANSFVSKKQHEIAESIFRSVGVIAWLEEENLLNAVTALSGNGPGYFFLMMEALEDAAVTLGLSKKIAHLLLLQTAYGASRMALESSEELSELRRHVTSPGGATEQAIRVFEEKNIREIFLHALQAAEKRLNELANQKLL